MSEKPYNPETEVSPEAYILQQPPERQPALRELRETILAHLSAGFEETMQYGMISYVVPYSVFPDGYHVAPHDPLPFLALANQKQYIALYHLALYADDALLDWFKRSYAALGIGKPDIGKSCIRFKNTAKIPFALVGSLCEKMSVEAYLLLYQNSRAKAQPAAGLGE